MSKIALSENKYLFNGKELQDEQLGGVNLDLYDYHLRFYDPALARFTTQDPLAEEFSSWTPYHYVHNNPIIFTDPTGMFANPIYDEEAKFLGTDDKGLQGEAIIMNKDDFKQGMAHSEAVDKGSLRSEMPLVTSPEIFDKIDSHQAGLSGRPDWDGKLTFGEVTKWSNEGSGEPLFVDGSKIDLRPINVGDVKDAAKNNNGYINFFKDGKMSTGSVYGNLKVTLTNEKTGNVQLGKNGLLDIHDFKNPAFKAVNDLLYPGKPKDFKIYCAPCNNKVGTE